MSWSPTADSEVALLARGRWPSILTHFGIAPHYLTKKQGPCPCCGGKDRFRFDDVNGSGSFFCNQCRPGTGAILLAKFKGISVSDAVRMVADYLGGIGATSPAAVERQERDWSKVEKGITEMWAAGARPGIVDTYLRSRGLPGAKTTVLRGHPSCAYYDDATHKLLGRYPAVLAPISSPDGKMICVQRIYVGDVKPRKKTMTPVGTISGAAVRLFEPVDGVLGVSEGVETGLAAHELFGVPVWAALSANGMESFVPPAGIRRLLVFGDNDANGEGQCAAWILAREINRRNRRNDVEADPCEVHIPPRVGTDWLDQWNEERG